MFWPFFGQKKTNVIGWILIHRWDLDLIFRLGFDKKTNRNRKPSMGWWLNPSRHPPVGKIPLPPAIQQPERLAKWKNGSPSQSHGPVFGDAPIKLGDSRILGMSFERNARKCPLISAVCTWYLHCKNTPKKSPSNGRTVFVFSTATKTRGVSHVIWDSSTCNYSNWLISFHKNSHSFQCIMHIYYSAYITNESFLVDMGPLPIVRWWQLK